MCQLSCSDLENSFVESEGLLEQGDKEVWQSLVGGLDGSLDQMEQTGSSQVPAGSCCHRGTV